MPCPCSIHAASVLHPCVTMLHPQVLLAFQNGQWIWPGVRVGYEREVVASDGTTFTMETLSLRSVTHTFLSNPPACVRKSVWERGASMWLCWFDVN